MEKVDPNEVCWLRQKDPPGKVLRSQWHRVLKYYQGASAFITYCGKILIFDPDLYTYVGEFNKHVYSANKKACKTCNHYHDLSW